MLNIKERLKSIKLSKKKVWLMVVALIVVSGSIVYFNNSKVSKTVNSDVLTSPVQRGTIQQTIEGTGTLQPNERYVFKTKTGGTVEEVFVSEGTQVKAGDPILRISNESINTQNRLATLDWELAQESLKELLNLSEDSYDLRAAELKVEQYRIALENLQDQKDALVLKAPFDGTLLSTEVSVGQKLNTGTLAAKFGSSREVEVVAQIDEKDISSISTGMEANVYVKGLSKDIKGKVKEIAFTGDATTGKFQVLIALDNPDDTIRQGMQTYNTIIIVNDPEQNIFIYKQGFGYIRYTESDELKTEVTGTVSEILRKPGDKVIKDDPIILLTNADLDRQVKDAELQLAKAQEDLQTLLEPTGTKVKQQELKVLQSYQSYLTAKEKADSLFVTSPIDGVVVNLAVSPGEELSNETLEQDLVVVSSFQQTEMKISVDELDINKLKMGQEAIVTVGALPEARLKGTITGIAYEGTTTNDITKYNVTLAVEYTEGIKGGMSATATIYLDKKENVLRIPAEAVTTSNGRSTVKVMVNGQPQVKLIEVGLTTSRWVEVTNGLQEGDQIVVASSTTSGGQGLFVPGMGGGAAGGNFGGARPEGQRNPTQGR